MTDTDDADLWRRVREGDTVAFGDLFCLHGPTIHRYALRRTGDPHAAEDVCAVVFLEAWRRRDDVELHQPSLLPWLYGVAGNTVRTWNRSRRRHEAALGRLQALPEPTPVATDRQALAITDAVAVAEKVQRLPERYRDVVVLSVWEGLTHLEIAEALGISVGTVKSRLSRARARLGADALRSSELSESADDPAPAVIVPDHRTAAQPLSLKELT